MAKTLRTSVGETAVFGRYGGFFVILLGQQPHQRLFG
ncbi:hypothetical protein VU12_05260 [Desulfobulbus sp. US4]|nr:hypothetical protein [Desulfobulbus sp. US4]